MDSECFLPFKLFHCSIGKVTGGLIYTGAGDSADKIEHRFHKICLFELARTCVCQVANHEKDRCQISNIETNALLLVDPRQEKIQCAVYFRES